jgi:hypothetical protein
MRNDPPVKKCKWNAIFNLEPRIIVAKVKSLPDVKLLTVLNGTSTFITEIEITAPELSFIEATKYSEEKANRCADIISFTTGFSVSCTLRQINEVGTAGTVKTGAATYGVAATFYRPQEVNITTPKFSNILHYKDEKLARQLSHFRKGISSSDMVQKIREFYQVVEDEYSKHHPFIEKYKYVRDLVSHPEMTFNRSKAEAKKIVGKEYFDPSSPQDMAALEIHLEQIEGEAERIIKSKI